MVVSPLLGTLNEFKKHAKHYINLKSSALMKNRKSALRPWRSENKVNLFYAEVDNLRAKSVLAVSLTSETPTEERQEVSMVNFVSTYSILPEIPTILDH